MDIAKHIHQMQHRSTPRRVDVAQHIHHNTAGRDWKRYERRLGKAEANEEAEFTYVNEHFELDSNAA